jgi:exodeoxyribonuclease VII large subunit
VDDLAPDTFTVGQLNRLVRDTLALTFPDEVWVEGEIASLRRHEASGNVYFQLVDPGRDGNQAEAALAVVLYRANKEAVNRRLRRARPAGAGLRGPNAETGLRGPNAETGADGPGPGDPPATLAPAIRMADGVHIRIRGGIELVPRTGRLHLRMTSIDPAHTLGRLAAERDRVLAALAAEGLLDRNAGRPFPDLPTRLGLVTSGGSAAQADFLHELGRGGGSVRPLRWRVTAVLSRVQGRGADREMAAALRTLQRHDVDVIALVRGGGSRTDLFAFDSEVLARAIAGARVPVVTGIGHEIDTSVADRVAARAFKTPTACAAALADLARRSADRPEEAWRAIREQAAAVVERQTRDLQTTGRRVAFACRVRLDGHDDRIARDRQRLRSAARTALGAAERDGAARAARLDAVDPARVLARGWSITRTADGRLVRSPADAEPGTGLVTTVAGGDLHSTVEPDLRGPNAETGLRDLNAETGARP